MKWQVSLNNNSFDRAGITKDCQDAVCEYIWNGFEAGATQISVSLQGASMQEAMQLVVKDNGSGIPYKNLNETFGTFLSSLKNTSEIRIKSQSNKGKGRFSYLAFSSSAEWETIYEDEGQLKSYCIQTDSADKSRFETTQPVIATEATQTLLGKNLDLLAAIEHGDSSRCVLKSMTMLKSNMKTSSSMAKKV